MSDFVTDKLQQVKSDSVMAIACYETRQVSSDYNNFANFIWTFNEWMDVGSALTSQTGCQLPLYLVPKHDLKI